MQSCLEFAVEKADIVLFQEPWMSREHTTVSHPSFTSIVPTGAGLRPRVCAFVAQRHTQRFTLRLDICSDPDIQAITMTEADLSDTLILNVYNETSAAEESTWTVDRVLKNINLSDRAIVCGDFNAHHPW